MGAIVLSRNSIVLGVGNGPGARALQQVRRESLLCCLMPEPWAEVVFSGFLWGFTVGT